MRLSKCALIGAAVAACAASPAPAGMFENVLDGLRVSGFTLGVDHSDLSRSTVAAAGTTFQGNTIDFGDFDVTLAGPVAAVVERGGRGIPTLDVILSTGTLNVNPNGVVTVGAPQPLAYTINMDTGTNETNIAGNFLLDARASVNRYGSYDLKLQLSSRQTTEIRGRFDDNSPSNLDFDLGPIDIEGNIFADVLATVTDPFFESAGVENVFALFSGRTFREAKARDEVDSMRAAVEAGGTLTGTELARLSALSLVADVLGDDFPDVSFISAGLPDPNDPVAGDRASANAIVPEPSTVFLLAMCLPAALLRRRRRR